MFTVHNGYTTARHLSQTLKLWGYDKIPGKDKTQGHEVSCFIIIEIVGISRRHETANIMI